MSTNLQIITDALRSLNVIDTEETPSSDMGSNCLRKLNQMMAEWKDADGIDLGYFAQSSTAATCPIPAWAERGVWGRLAIMVASDYGAQLTPSAIQAADEGRTTILRTVLNQKLEGADMRHLPLGSGHFGDGQYDISTDQ